MKVLVTGVTGLIGAEALNQALLRPEITSVVAIARRELPSDVANNSKLQVIILKDFNNWPEDVLEQIKDADAMIWALGTSDDNRAANLNFPMAFQTSFVKTVGQRVGKFPFRYIHLSGKLVEQDQDKPLWFLPVPRKTKGLAESQSIDLAKRHSDVWQVFIVKPGGVFPKGSYASGAIMALTGSGWFIRADQLGAVMADLAIKGGEKGTIILNPRLLEKGNELLKARN